MRYAINFDKLINRYVPYYMGGRKLILYLQAIMKPMQSLNNDFANYATETRIEASMTSQVFRFEWFLNRKFSKYFADGGQIAIKNSEHLGIPIYYGNANIPLTDHMVLYNSSEDSSDTTALYHQNEKAGGNLVSFVVSSPTINTTLVSQKQYEAMLRYYIDKYRIFGKTYTINYTSNE